MPQGAFKTSWKPPARERSDLGGGGGESVGGGCPPSQGVELFCFSMWNCVFWCILQRVFSHISTDIISVFNWVLGTYCHIVIKRKKKKSFPLFGKIRKSGNFRKCGISDYHNAPYDIHNFPITHWIWLHFGTTCIPHKLQSGNLGHCHDWINLIAMN